MKKLTIGIYILFASVIMATFSASCGDKQSKWREEKVDSLALVLKSCEEMMAQDNDILRARSAKIQSSLNKLRMFASDTFARDFIRSIDQYMAAKKIYDRYLEHHAEMYIELNALKTQLLSLKSSSDKGILTDDQFKNYISKERNDIYKLHELCEEIAEPINKLEPMYIRISPKIESFADSLAKEKTKAP